MWSTFERGKVTHFCNLGATPLLCNFPPFLTHSSVFPFSWKVQGYILKTHVHSWFFLLPPRAGRVPELHPRPCADRPLQPFGVRHQQLQPQVQDLFNREQQREHRRGGGRRREVRKSGKDVCCDIFDCFWFHSQVPSEARVQRQGILSLRPEAQLNRNLHR